MCCLGIHALIYIPIYRGLTMHIMQRFNLQQLCQSIQTNKITITYVVPPVVLLLAKHPTVDKYNLGSLRLIHSAAAPLTNDLIEMVYTRLKVPVKQSYGMSEASPGICTQVYPLLITRSTNTEKYLELGRLGQADGLSRQTHPKYEHKSHVRHTRGPDRPRRRDLDERS